MAKRKLTTKIKKKPTRSTRLTKGAGRKSLDDIHYGPEPARGYFEDHSIHDFFGWYNYMWDRNKSMTALIKYAQKFGYKNAKKFKKLYIPSTLAYIATGLENGLNFPKPKKANDLETGTQYYYALIHEELRQFNKKAQVISDEDFDKEQIVKNKRKTVQEHIAAKVNSLLGDIDYAIDVWDVEVFNTYKYLTDKQVSSTVASKIPEQYQDLIDEVTEALEGKSKQLKEAYAFMNTKEKRGYIAFVRKIQTDAERYAENHKPVRKAKKIKLISAEDKVKKLNFLKEDEDNKLTSIEPSEIIGAELLFLFNSKTNQLSYYHTTDRGGLDVKGASIKNFDTDTSAVKKLGAKTTYFLDRVLGGGKITLNKIMNEINSKASEATGRVNNNMIILKVN